jgi:hypothetical protein
MTRNLPIKLLSTHLSKALKQNDSKLALSKLSGLTITKILDVREEFNDVEFDYSQAKRELFFLEETEPSKKNTWKDVKLEPAEKEKLITALKERISNLEIELSKTAYLPMLIELRRENEEELLDTLQLMILEIVKFHKTTELMTPAQIFETAFMVMDTFKGLTLEDVALCFYQAKRGQFGEIYNRIDGAVILNWLHGYQDRMRAVGMERELQRHLQSKGTMYKEGGQYRVSDLKAKGIDINPSLNLRPVKKLGDLL